MKLRLFRQVLALTLSFQLVSGPVWAENNATQTTAVQNQPAAQVVGNQPANQVANQPNPATLQEATQPVGQRAEYGEYQATVDACEKAVDSTKKSCDEGIAASASAFLPIGSTTTSSNISNASTAAAQTEAGQLTVIAAAKACRALFATSCVAKCEEKNLGPEPVQSAPPTPADVQRLKDYEQAKVTMKHRLDSGGIFKGGPSCKSVVNNALQQFASGATTAQAGKKGMGDIMKYLIGAAVIGGGYMLLKGKGKDKEAEEKAKTDAANGVIKDSSGNDLACFTPDNFTRSECKSTLISMCQGEKADTSGCRSFEAAYCANEGSGSNYCLYAETKVYCAQSGDGIAKSPACTWKSSRPSSCLTSPEDVGCLASGTAEALTLSCANYPNDPLCAANSAGRVVVQGGSSTTTTPVATTSKVGASSMSSVIGTSSARTPASSLQVISSSENMWSSSSAAVKNACATGALVNCM